MRTTSTLDSVKYIMHLAWPAIIEQILLTAATYVDTAMIVRSPGESSASLRLAMCLLFMLNESFCRGFLRFAARFVQFEIHQVKIGIFSIDFEKMGKRTQLPKAVLFIQVDGAGIAAAHFKI